MLCFFNECIYMTFRKEIITLGVAACGLIGTSAANVQNYTIDVDMSIAAGGGGILFSHGTSGYMLWNFVKSGSKVTIEPTPIVGGENYYDDVPVGECAYASKMHVTLAVACNVVTTTVNGKEIGKYTDTYNVITDTQVGFYATNKNNERQSVTFDNVVVKSGEQVLVNEDFEEATIVKYFENNYVAEVNGNHVLQLKPSLKNDLAVWQRATPVDEASVGAESDYWAVTDALGREVTPYSTEMGEQLKKEKKVALFYWTWHQSNNSNTDVVKNVSRVLHKYPEAMQDPDHRAWKGRSGHYYWGEPIFGYYRTDDPWVLRKHAEMLADAKVDVVFFDCTNGDFTWDVSYKTLLKVWNKAKKDGVNVPKVSFMFPFSPTDGSKTAITRVYNEWFKSGVYKDLWFVWKGKPMIMGYPDNFNENIAEEKEIIDFFTWRPGQPDYVTGPTRSNQWGWLETQQHGYTKTATGKYEEVPVGVAQNASEWSNGHCCAFARSNTFGRSYSKTKGFDPRTDAYLYGWNFDEQWDNAYKLDPELVFVTGWNEWTSGAYYKSSDWPSDLYNIAFVDEFDWDRSRDVEPTKDWGDNGDVYYCRLVDRVRKFKGMLKRPDVSAPKTISLSDFGAWEAVKPFYKAYRGNTTHRDHKGIDNTYYTNNTGRNDIVGAKVARDANKVYFYVQTDSDMTAYTDKNWMMLFIDIDRDKSTGWQGYDYVINRVSPSATQVVVEKNVGGTWNWETCGSGEYVVNGKEMALAIDRSVLAAGTGTAYNFEFKWCDNLQDLGNIMDFYVSGDVAPGGRFNYVFDTKDNSGVVNVQTDTKVEVYPNPATDKVFVQGITGRADVMETGTGRVLASGACGDTGIDVSGLAPGIYLVKAGATVHKFIKK